jgi:hypothetical protein
MAGGAGEEGLSLSDDPQPARLNKLAASSKAKNCLTAIVRFKVAPGFVISDIQGTESKGRDKRQAEVCNAVLPGSCKSLHDSTASNWNARARVVVFDYLSHPADVV